MVARGVGCVGCVGGVIDVRQGEQVHHLPHLRGRAPELGAEVGNAGAHRCRRAGERLHESVEHGHQPAPTRVDHPGGRQRRQLVGRVRQRLGRLLGGQHGDVGDARPAFLPRRERLQRRGHGVQDAQHRARDRARHRLRGGRVGGAQRADQRRAVEHRVLGRRRRHAPQHLREDGSGVAPRGPDRRGGRGGQYRARPRAVERVEAVPRGGHGVQEVRAGVGVGHRIDVDVVDLGPQRAQIAYADVDPPPHRVRVQSV